MQADEARIVFDEWMRIALEQQRPGLPASLRACIESDIPDGSQWAVVDARMLLALGRDRVLRSLGLDDDGQISRTNRALVGCLLTAAHRTELVKFYRDSETLQRHHWEFSIEGEHLVALTGTVYGEAGRPRDRPDRVQRLAFALQQVADGPDQ